MSTLSPLSPLRARSSPTPAGRANPTAPLLVPTVPGPQIPDRPAPRTWAQAITVRGGPRGETAELVELLGAAAALDEAGDALHRAAAAASRVLATVETSADRSPWTAVRASSACSGLLSSATGLPAGARDVAGTGAAVRAAVRGYAAAEGAAERLVRALRITSGYAVGSLGPGGWLTLTGAGVVGTLAVGRRALVLRVLRRLPTATGLALRALDAGLDRLDGPLALAGWLVVGDGPVPRVDLRDARTIEALMPWVGGFLQGALPGPGRPDRAVLGELTGEVPIAESTARALDFWLQGLRVLAGVEPSRVVVGHSLVQPPPAAQAPPRTTSDLVGGIGRTYPPHPGGPGAAPPGTVEIKELQRPDGTHTWVVTVPGTQEWGGLQQTNPFDLASNVALMAGQVDDITTAVERAMELAGIPPGDPVVIAGHSQGGIAAARIAADPALADRFDVQAVVTVGSPVGHIELPPGVVGIHLENGRDGVHALDAAPNPDTPTRTTVSVDHTTAPGPAARAAALSPLVSHEVQAYERATAELEELGDPRWEAAIAPVEELVAGTTTVGTTWYTATRVPADAAAAPGSASTPAPGPAVRPAPAWPPPGLEPAWPRPRWRPGLPGSRLLTVPDVGLRTPA